MALDNKTALENLLKQKVEMEQQLAQVEVLKQNYLRVCGAVDVLQQILESDEEVVDSEGEE
jgi:hypothetical protein